jgi:uncharacterized protein YjbI with pentapeptide repeats
MKINNLLRMYEAGTRDFAGVDLAGAELQGVALIGINLRGANLSSESWDRVITA